LKCLGMNCAIIVAAGKGVRMGTEVDKLLLTVRGQPVIAHTWRRFEACAEIQEIVLVVREGRQGEFDALGGRYGFRKPFRCVAGGRERQDSVWNGLEALRAGTELVAIQDGARPCTSAALITATLAAAREVGAAVAAQRVTDTIKESADGQDISRHLDRARLWAVQTPQCFRVEVIRKALGTVRGRGISVTDDTAACEWIGQPVRLVESAEPNPKVTVKADLAYIELLLGSAE
jgi:2-C-methyl-D-erythritol 4-phosphate cytidylyltransferase